MDNYVPLFFGIIFVTVWGVVLFFFERGCGDVSNVYASLRDALKFGVLPQKKGEMNKQKKGGMCGYHS